MTKFLWDFPLMSVRQSKGAFTNYVYKSPCFYIFYGTNVDKKWTFLDHLPTSFYNVVCECTLMKRIPYFLLNHTECIKVLIFHLPLFFPIKYLFESNCQIYDGGGWRRIMKMSLLNSRQCIFDLTAASECLLLNVSSLHLITVQIRGDVIFFFS